jgi:peptide/nickel transport system substrate-binding protein
MTVRYPSIVALWAATILAGCGGGEAPEQPSAAATTAAPATGERTLTIGISQFPSTMHPNIESMVAKSYVRAFLARPLTLWNADWEVVCGICLKLPTIENGLAVLETTPDGEPGIAITFEIPAGAAWGDGAPLTSADFEFAWQVGRNAQTGANNTEMYRRTYQFDVVNERKFVLHIDRVSFDYNRFGNLYPLPKHEEAELFADDPYEYRHRTNYNADPTIRGLWFGPFVLTDFQQGSSLTLERNPHWFGQEPYFDRVVIRAIQNTSALEANLRSGTIDMIAGELGLQLDQALAFEKRHGEQYDIIFKSGLHYEHIDLNLENPILADKRVRHAIMHGISRAMISDRLFDGRQPVAHTSISPLDKNASDNITRYSYDPDKAQSLLDAAGWTEFRDGVRYNETGTPLRLEIMSTAGDKTRERVQQVLQSQLGEIGLDLRIRNEAARVFFGQTTRERRFSGMAMFAWVSAPDNVPRSTLHSSEIPTAENNYAGQNYTTFSLPELDDIIDALELELDEEKRFPLWERIQQIYSEEIPIIPLYFRANAYILPKWLKGLRPTGHLDPSSNAAEHWHREDGDNPG